MNKILRPPTALINPETGKPFHQPVSFTPGEEFLVKGVKFKLRKVLKKDIVLRLTDKNISFNSNETSLY